MIFDSHIHTKFSADSEMPAADALARAKSLNLGLVFTEHFDYGLELNGKKFTFDPAAYMNEYKNLRGDNLRLGVEIGMRKSARQKSDNRFRDCHRAQSGKCNRYAPARQNP